MHLDEALRVHQDVVFTFMTPSDWLSPSHLSLRPTAPAATL